MAAVVSRSFGFVCKSCQLQQLKIPSRSISTFALGEPSARRKPAPASTSLARSEHRRKAHTPAFTFPSATSTRSSRLPATSSPSRPRKSTSTDPNPIQTLSNLRSDVSQITSANAVPDEVAVLELINRIYEFSNLIVFGQSEAPSEADLDNATQSTNTILDDLDEPSKVRSKTNISHGPATGGMSISFRNKAADTICELIYELVRDHKVFISPTILQVYTRVQCLLGKPEHLPEIFNLYAHKPKPIPNSSPMRYTDPWPNTPKMAVPMDLSDAALDCAIQKKDIPLAVAIIDTTVATTAFKLHKLLRQATLPTIALTCTPFIAYAGATWVSNFQVVWDTDTAVYTTMAGAFAYIGTLSTIGFVAITTWNDQMQRVTWAIGHPLTQRWLREEEREYFDRVALAWGFQEKWRRGEEQGEEWEALRELVGQRDMVLDKTELMDGME